MEHTIFYYTNVLGYTPDESNNISRTENTIKYLADNGYSSNEIKAILMGCDAKEALTINDLPDTLWNNSLINRNGFYYHRVLQITNPPPVFDPVSRKEIMSPYYLEMKIQFTIEDLVKYFYKLNIDNELINMTRDTAAMKSLLNQYSKLSTVESLDFVLALIDYAKYSHDRILRVFDITKNEAEVLDSLKRLVAEARFSGRNHVVWRP